MKKFIAIILSSLVLSGCGSSVETDKNPIKSVSNEYATTIYNSDIWSDISQDPYILLQSKIAKDSGTNISFAFGDKLDEDDNLEIFTNNLLHDFSSMGYSLIDASITNLDGEFISVINIELEYTTEYITNMLELGLITEDELESIGGIPKLLEFPKTYQVVYSIIIDDMVYSVTGTYYNNEDLDHLLESLETFVLNIEPK